MMTVLKRKTFRIPNEAADEMVELHNISEVGDEFFRKMPDDPIHKAGVSVKTYREHPLKFIKHELGISIDDWKDDLPPKKWRPGIHPIPLWSKQREIITSLVKHKKVVVKSGHGLGKCPGIMNWILLADGSLVRAKDLQGKKFEVLSYKDGEQVVKTAFAERNGFRECVRVTYQCGISEIVTKNHLFWAGTRDDHFRESGSRKRGTPLVQEKGWMLTENLKIGDCVASPDYLNVTGSEKLDDDWVKIVAYLIGDGRLTNGIMFFQDDNKQLSEFKELVERKGCDLIKYGDKFHYRVRGKRGVVDGNYYNPITTKVIELGLYGKTSATKSIPQEVMSSTKEQIALFLSRLYSTDGLITYDVKNTNTGNKKGRTQYQIGFSSISKELIEQIYCLLKRLGIKANIGGGVRLRKINGKMRDYESYTINIIGYENIVSFCDQIKIYGKEIKQNALLTLLRRRTDKKKLFKWKNEGISPGFYWEKIVKLEPIYYPTVAIQVEDTKSYITPYSYEHNSFIAATSALYLHYAWKALGITTAPTFRQVRRVLWGEIHNLYHNAPRKLGGKLYQTSLESGDKWFIEGLSVKDPSTSITGFHEESIFIIIDEAGGVGQEVFDSMEGILTSKNSFVLLIGNPLDSASAFADAFKDNSGYHRISMSCYDCPNVRHQQEIYSKLCAAEWPEKMRKKWGVDSNLFRVRVLGEFPEEGRDTLIPVKYIDLAHDRMGEYKESTKVETLVSFGADIARFGTDQTVIGARWINQIGVQRFQVLERTEKQRTDETTDAIVRWYDRLVPQGERPPINVDDIGLGGGVTDNLTRKSYPVNGLNVGETPDTYIEHEDIYLNKRAQYYWKLRELFMTEKVVLDDDSLEFELSKISLAFTSTGRIKIEDKDKIRKKLSGKSPDDADCMMLCFGEDEEESAGGLIFLL